MEASPLLEDNQWMLDLAAREPIILGTCGDIEIGKAGFGNGLERFQRADDSTEFASGNLWNRNLVKTSKSRRRLRISNCSRRQASKWI